MRAFFVDARAIAGVDLIRNPLQPPRVVGEVLKLITPSLATALGQGAV